MRFGGLKFAGRWPEDLERYGGGGRDGRKDREGKILGGGKDSLGLEDQRETGIGGISRRVTVGRGRRARRRHTEVRSSYHFRVRTKVNSTP
ncbi:hypothetical protein BY996DRAFT_6589373 [Phakopsora pachyrhizi]|nr:hypothetical protein BY996DRAFT_6589373 [Phakopsora pachyrhizi]